MTLGNGSGTDFQVSQCIPMVMVTLPLVFSYPYVYWKMVAYQNVKPYFVVFVGDCRMGGI